jgi:Na+/alanine symporter
MKNIKENIKKAKDIINNLTFNENTLNILTFYKKMTFRSRLIYLITITLGIYGGIEFLYNFSDILLAAIIIPNMIGLLILSDEVKDLKINFSKIQNIIIHQNNIYLLN